MTRGLPKWALVFAALAVCVLATPAPAADNHPPKYEVEYVGPDGKETRGTFDLSKPEESEKF